MSRMLSSSQGLMADVSFLFRARASRNPKRERNVRAGPRRNLSNNLLSGVALTLGSGNMPETASPAPDPSKNESATEKIGSQIP